MERRLGLDDKPVSTMALDTELLARLVRARRACLAGLRDIGKKQIELIEQGNMTALLDVLAAKHRPLAELQRIERALDPFRGENPAGRRWASPEDRAACARAIDECEALLAEIVRQEKHCEQALLRQRDETAARLARFRLAGQVRGAYVAAPPDARHIDLCSER
jgi:hypothetical protein